MMKPLSSLLVAVVWLLTLEPWLALMGHAPTALSAQEATRAKLYRFKVDPATPLAELLPAPPAPLAAPLPWEVTDLKDVPEVLLERFEPGKAVGPVAAAKAAERVAHTIAKINQLNRLGPEHFIQTLRGERPDLFGLPWIDAADCRMTKERGKDFFDAVTWGRAGMRGPKKGEPAKPGPEQVNARLTVMRQMHLADAPGLGKLVKDLENLEDLAHAPTTHALAGLALFAADAKVRKEAAVALKGRPAKDYSSQLLAGLRYPWPAVAEHAAEALIALERSDLLPQVADVLDEPDPRAPVWKNVGAAGVVTVREVVRLNHNRNCLLCHAPGNTADVEFDEMNRPKAVVTGPVPVPSQRLPAAYYSERTPPELLVRADVTYLRQDFSLQLAVADASPWPDVQRFDFLVRERELTPHEITLYFGWKTNQGPGYLSPYQQAALATLRSLAGYDAPEPTSQAWRRRLLEK